MKALKTVRKVGDIIRKAYSQAVDALFNAMFFGSFKVGKTIDMYRSEHYRAASGGVM
ncbi:MAG: hypothetical protein LBL94_00495 [Prevotellaceae bacterium]|jgi:hypothetical protein|nr:hypothetical protein [Prevotellaceae bacterium]